MKTLNTYHLLLLSLTLLSTFALNIQQTDIPSLENLAQQLASHTSQIRFDVKTAQGLSMDCLKAIITKNKITYGVFHTSIEQSTTGYNGLYLAKWQNNAWQKVIKLSQRGSQPTIFEIPESTGYLILYELQNHKTGNTVAIRYYQDDQSLNSNNFLYEYQLSQTIGGRIVQNVGTPSVESLQLQVKEYDPKFSQYKLSIKYHFSPDGQRDYPGYGHVDLIPLRDFIDKKGFWVGGCKQNYAWSGQNDTKVYNAIRRLGITGKIGQRDSFQLVQAGSTRNYYLYEANLNSAFDWSNWRIVLYGSTEDRAVLIPFDFYKVVDLANPHISLLTRNTATQQYVFWLSFFIPSEGVKDRTTASPGQFTAQVSISF